MLKSNSKSLGNRSHFYFASQLSVDNVYCLSIWEFSGTQILASSFSIPISISIESPKWTPILWYFYGNPIPAGIAVPMHTYCVRSVTYTIFLKISEGNILEIGVGQEYPNSVHSLLLHSRQFPGLASCTKWWAYQSFIDFGLFQWRNDGVAAASSDGGPTGGRGPRQFYFILNQRGGALT